MAVHFVHCAYVRCHCLEDQVYKLGSRYLMYAPSVTAYMVKVSCTVLN